MAAADDVDVGYGWTFPAAISAVIVMVAVLLVIIIHLRYLSRTQLATRILMGLCFSIFLFQVNIVVVFNTDNNLLAIYFHIYS